MTETCEWTGPIALGEADMPKIARHLLAVVSAAAPEGSTYVIAVRGPTETCGEEQTLLLLVGESFPEAQEPGTRRGTTFARLAALTSEIGGRVAAAMAAARDDMSRATHPGGRA